MSADMQPQPHSTAPIAAASPSPAAPPTPLDEPSQPTDAPPTASPTPAAAETNTQRAITGLTPEQVFQELQKSGYVDQLRRQLNDAFGVSGAPVASAGVSANTSAPANAQSSSTAPAPPAATTVASGPPAQTDITATIATSATTASTANASALAPTSTNPTTTNPSNLDIGTRDPFLAFLSTPLRQHLERDHGNLRIADPRQQQATLLQKLETSPVDYPRRNELGEATLYDLLLRHLVMSPAVAESGTAGILDRHTGRLGKEADTRIQETIAELLNPSAKGAEDEDDDDDDDDDDDEDDGDEATSALPSQLQPAQRTMDES